MGRPRKQFKSDDPGDRKDLITPGLIVPKHEGIDPRFAAAPISLIGLYNAIYASQGEGFPNHLLPLASALMDTRIEKLMMICGPGSGKALRNSTPVLTVNGWLPIETIKIGDEVITQDGKTPSKVVAVFPQPASKLYKVTFADGREIYCNEDHLWGVYIGQGIERRQLLVENTKYLADKLEKKTKVSIPLCGEVGSSPKDSKVTLAYIWGACFARGHYIDSQRVLIESNDRDFLETFNYIKHPEICISRIPNGILVTFNEPECPFFWPEINTHGFGPDWKKAFIAGVLDSSETQTSATYIKLYLKKKDSLITVQKILWSLGVSARFAESLGEGQALVIYPRFNPFFCQRKISKFKHKFHPDSFKSTLKIVSIEQQVIPELSTCICITDPAGLFLADNYIVTHNSRLLLGIFPTWMLGVDPSSTFVSISASEGLPLSFMRTTAQIIEFSPYFKRAFPEVRPDKDAGWGKSTGLYVTGRPIGDSKASYFCAGIDSSVLTGLHANHILMDDLHDKDNAYTPEQRKKVVDTYYNTLFHRSVAKGTRYIMSGRRWAEDDILGHLTESGEWVVLTLPAERSGSRDLYYDVTVPEGMECIFTDPGQAEEVESSKEFKEKGLRSFKAYYGVDPEREGFYWPEHKGKRAEWHAVKKNSPDIAESIYQCRPGQRSGSIFKPAYFSYFSYEVSEITPRTLPDFLQGQKIVQSWDTSHGNQNNAFSACITGALIPCNRWHRGEDAKLIGPADPHLDIYIIDCFKDRLAIDALLHAIRQKHLFWQASEVCIEEKSSGIPALQMLPAAGCPIIPMKAWTGKRNRAIETIDGGSLSVEGWFRLGRVHFWMEAPWLYDLEVELKNFTGDNSGFKDQVDALVYLVARAIRLSAGKITLGDGNMVPANETIAKRELRSASPDADMWDQFEAINAALSMPSEEQTLCYTCDHFKTGNFCSIQKRKVSALDSCMDWKSKGPMQRSGSIILPNNISMFGGFPGA